MTIQALQNLVPQSIQTEYKSFVANDHVQKILFVASDAMKKCSQATSSLLPKEITKDISIDSVVEKIKTCVCNISGAQYCLLFGLTWVSRQIPLVCRISFVFEAAMLVSVLHVFKRMDENNAKSAEENRKFRESNATASELTLKDKQAIADLNKVIDEFPVQLRKKEEAYQQIHDQHQRTIAELRQIIHELKTPQHLNVESIRKLALIAKQIPQKQADKIAARKPGRVHA
jgi:hypothetical protein